MRLVKSGYAKSLREAAELTAPEVLQALAYDAFLTDYESTFWELNRCQKD